MGPYPKGANTLRKLGGSESGEARIKGAKRPKFESKARIKGEARERAGGGGSVSPSPENFLNFELKSFNLVYSWKVNLEIIDFSKKT